MKMNKGKIVLTQVDKPVEGMKVVWKDSPGFPEINLFISSVKGNKVGIKGSMENLSAIEADISELQQIAIEYEKKDEENGGWGYFIKATLPLLSTDWEYAIKHIGEEVEFSTTLTEKYGFGEAYIMAAKPSPIIYTEEEVTLLFNKLFWDMRPTHKIGAKWYYNWWE